MANPPFIGGYDVFLIRTAGDFDIGLTSKMLDAIETCTWFISAKTFVSGEKRDFCTRRIEARCQNCMVDQQGACFFAVIFFKVQFIVARYSVLSIFLFNPDRCVLSAKNKNRI